MPPKVPPLPDDAPAKPEPRKGLLGLPRSEEGLGKIVNFLGNDLFFMGHPPQTVPDLAGNVGMGIGMSLIPIAGPALTRLGYTRLARFIVGMPGPIQRILAGAMGDEIARDLAIAGTSPTELPGRLGEGLKSGAEGAAIGEGIGAGVKAGGAAVRAMGRGATAVAKRTPIVGPVLRQMSIEKRAAGKSALQMQKETERRVRDEYETARRAYEGAETARRGEYAKEVKGFKRGTEAAAKETQAKQVAAGDQTIQEQLKRGAQGTAESMGERVGKVSPPLAFKTAGEASEMGAFRGRYKKSLGQYWKKTIEEAEGMLPPNTTIRVPALARANPEAEAAIAQMEQVFKRPLNEAELKVVQDQFGAKDRFTLTELAEELKNHQAGFRGTGAFSDTRTRMGLQDRKLYATALQQAEEDIRSHPGGDQAWERFHEGRLAFSVGDILLKMWGHEKAFERGPNDVVFSLDGLQQLIRKNAQKLEDRMPADDFKALKRIIFGGEDINVASAPRVGKTGVEGGGIMPYRKAEGVPTPPERPTRGPGPWLPKPERPAFMQGPATPGSSSDALRSREFPYPFSWKEWGQIAVDAGIERMVAPRPMSLTNSYQPGVGQVPPLPESPESPATGPRPQVAPPLPTD